jgi:protein SCO1/2
MLRKLAFSSVFLAALLALLVLTSSGCAKKEPPPSPSTEQKRYQVRGKVISVEKADKMVVLAHEDIPGFMEAMTMGFKLRDPRDLDRLQRGDRVEATLVLQGMESWLETLFITRPQNPDASDAEVLPKPLPMPKPGDVVPDVSLVNQDGRRLRLRDLRGKNMVITFIFSRCPLPEYCPRMNMNFARLAMELDRDPTRAAKVHLLTISFDPEYDTPAVLKKSRQAFDEPGRTQAVAWDFVTGRKTEIRRLADFFGLSYTVDGKNPEETTHTLRTAVIDAERKVVKVLTGNTWTVEEVLAELRKL